MYLENVKRDLEINKKWETKTDNGYIPSRSGEYRNVEIEELIQEVERLINWNKAHEQLTIDYYKLEKLVDQLKMDKEDMYQLATRAKFYESDWKEFERIFNK